MVDFLAATQRVESTMGLTLRRLFHYMKLALAYLLATSLAAGSGFAMGAWVKSSGTGGLLGAAAGFAVCAYFIHWSRRGRLYKLWAPHLSIFGRLVEEKSIPPAKKQLELGSQQVERLFDKSAGLMDLYSQSGTVLCELFIDKFNLKAIAALPVIGAGLTIKLSVLLASLRDVLLIFSLGEDIKNPWETMHNNLELVAKHLSSIQRSMLMVLIMQVVGTLLAFIVWYVAIDWLADHWPDIDMTAWKILLTGLLSWIMYAAFIYPIAVNAMLDEFLKITAQSPTNDTAQEQLADFPALDEIAKQAQTYNLPAETPEQEPNSTIEESYQDDDSDES
ncbi:MAG: hypothetical protein V3U88_00330 [Methylococcales bacterium]